MSTSAIKSFHDINLSNEQFNKLSHIISTEYGIKMPVEKKIMLQCRLQKRLRDLNIDNFEEYFKMLFDKHGNNGETTQMIDLVTTNKTDFFREPFHFEYLKEHLLPELEHKINIRIWSAGCSSGEECYTLAIVIKEFQEEGHKLDFQILGTDLSSKVLEKGVKAIYAEDKISMIPNELKHKYFLRSKDRSIKSVKVVKDLRTKVSFRHLNFMNPDYDIKESFDLIFCRNVLIYFERLTQEKVINSLCKKLNYGGYLFLGHSESIIGMNVPLVQLKPTIYKKI
jgi:chemotaxis protein methyltransferase CheR